MEGGASARKTEPSSHGVRLAAAGPSESTSLPSRLVLAVFCLVAAGAYRASVSLIPAGVLEGGFLLGLSGLFLLIAVLARRSQTFSNYWEIAFAFFVFTIAGFASDLNISPLQRVFVADVLHQTTSTNNPLASTVLGTVLVQLFSTLCLVIPVIVLTKASGSGLSSLYISRPKNWIGPVVGIVAFVVIFILAWRGRTAAFFPNNGVSSSRFLALAPALVFLVLANGLREELWFRGLFLNKYQRFFGPFPSNLLAAVIFTSFHVQVQYAVNIVPFLAYALILGLVAGWLMQKSGSIVGSALLHAGTDIPIFLVYLSYAT